MMKKSEISTDAVVGSSDFDLEWLAHWDAAAMVGEVRQFVIARVVQKRTDEIREILPIEMQSLPADFIAVNDLQWEPISFGALT